MDKLHGIEDIQGEVGGAAQEELDSMFELENNREELRRKETELQDQLWQWENNEILLFGQLLF